ncbi:hypothetical protein G3M48_004178 [Beauveria asiatica]|uniref:BTB domain-containing protein n=1 Tax=Beauveria asiatica TaxID=1069075 RepID=A0AAW0RTU5_9HYPO
MALPPHFIQKLHQNQTEGLFRDLQLLCDGQIIDVHKIIICSYSPVLFAALSGPYQEQDEGVYEIKDSSYPIVLGMVEFMYKGTYKVSNHDSTAVHGGHPRVLFHAGMVALADKYLIPSLRELALSKFKKCVNSETDFRPLLQSVSGVYAIQGDGNAELRRILVSHFEDWFASYIGRDGMEDLLRDISKTKTLNLQSILQ